MSDICYIVLVLRLICETKLRQCACCSEAFVHARDVHQINYKPRQRYHGKGCGDLLLELPDFILIKETGNVERSRVLYVLP